MVTTTTAQPSHPQPSAGPQAVRSRIGLIVAASMAAGLMAAALLVIAPLAPAEKPGSPAWFCSDSRWARHC